MSVYTGCIPLLFALLLALFPVRTTAAHPPAAAIEDLVTADMLDVLVGGRRDSTMLQYFRNSTSVPIRVDSLRITGADASSFLVLSPARRPTIPADSSLDLGLRFSPSHVGVHRATLEVWSLGVVTRGELLGNGVTPALEPTQDTIDFGIVEIGDFRDSAVFLATNVTGSDVDIPKVVQDGPDVPRFTVTGGGPTILSPGKTHTADIRFAPIRVGRAESRLRLEYNALGSPARIVLIGEGIIPRLAQATLEAPRIVARVGEIVEIPIRVRDARNLDLLGVTGFAATLRLNASMLLPVPPTPMGSLEGEDRLIALQLPMTARPDSVLLTLRFRAYVGNDSITPLKLEDPVAVGGNADMLAVAGSVALTGYCDAGGIRLIALGPALKLRDAVPNPSDGAITIGFDLVEDGATSLEIDDIEGRRVALLFDRAMTAGPHQIAIPEGTLPAGTYLCILRTPTEVRTMRVVVR